MRTRTLCVILILALLAAGAAASCTAKPEITEKSEKSENNGEDIIDMSSQNAGFVKPDRLPTMADYWDGYAYFEQFYTEPGLAHRATEIVPVNGVWYRFERYVNTHFLGSIGMNVCKSADKGLTWSEPVVITEPGGGEDWSMAGTDCGAYYDGSRWHLIFQSISLEPGSKWNLSYLACDDEDATAGKWFEPPGIVNPVVRNKDIWDQIAVGDNNCTRITRGQKLVYDEGTPNILVDNGVIYITFHGASNTHGTIFGYRGVATTEDFITYTAAAGDCIFSYLDAADWDVDWDRNGSVGGGAAAYIKDGEYWYTLIESPDTSLACVEGQMWPFGLLRSKSLTDTKWENWAGNPLPEMTPVGPAVSAWVYPTLFEDGGVTYLAASQCYPETHYAYRQYRLAWRDSAAEIAGTAPARPDLAPKHELQNNLVKTETAFEADMNDKSAWKMHNKVPAGVTGSLILDNGMYILAEDEISVSVTLDLNRNPRFSIVIPDQENVRLFVRLQIPGLAPQPGYDVGYIGYEALDRTGESVFDINEELNWLGYFDEREKEILDCTLNIWAHMATTVISGIRIEYYE